MEIKIEDIVFWIIMLLIIALAIWLLVGSPTDTASIIAIGIFVAGSEVLIWRTLFEKDKDTCLSIERLDKKTAISFEKVKAQLGEIQKDIKEIKLHVRK